MNSMISGRFVIFANGVLPDLEKVRTLLRPHDIILCADGGTRYALALGIMPAAVIGDLDSLDEPSQMKITAAEVALLQHPRDKDETDLELALQYALEQSPSAILIVGALGGRLDHTLGSLSMLADSKYALLDCRLDDGIEEIYYCRSACKIYGKPGDIVSLLPWGGTVTGVSTYGLKWPLHHEQLEPGKTRTLSNEMLLDMAEVLIEAGILLIVHRRES